MKKIISIFICLITIVPIAYGEDKVFEGYDGLPWGTTVEAFKEKYHSAIDITDEKDKLTKENVFMRNDEAVVRIYRFYNNSLYWGRTQYNDVDKATANAVLSKLRKKYNFLAFSGRNATKYVNSKTYYNATFYEGTGSLFGDGFNFKIRYEARDYYSTNNNYLVNMLLITYYDLKQDIAVENERINNSQLQL